MSLLAQKVSGASEKPAHESAIGLQSVHVWLETGHGQIPWIGKDTETVARENNSTLKPSKMTILNYSWPKDLETDCKDCDVLVIWAQARYWSDAIEFISE